MDYGRLSRRELQALCKEHGIPANKTNVFMAETLAALLNAPKETEETAEPVLDPAEVVQTKAKRGGRSKKVVEVLEASEVDELSTRLASSTLCAVSTEAPAFETAPEDIREAVVEAMIDAPMELPQEPEIEEEPVKVPRRPRATSKPKSKSLLAMNDAKPALHDSKPALDDAKPALEDPTLEVVLALEVDAVAPFETRFPSTYSRRVTKINELQLGYDAAPELTPAAPEEVTLSSGDDTTRTVTFAPVEEFVAEEMVPASTAVTKKPKAKCRKTKKVKPVSPISLPILEDAVNPKFTPGAAVEGPESPMFGLANDSVPRRDVPQRAVSLSPAPEEEFVFKPVPESFAEIMTPAKPFEELSKGCQHRIGRKMGKNCRSCASEKRIASACQDVLQVIRDPTVEEAAVEEAAVEEAAVEEAAVEEAAVEEASVEEAAPVAKTFTTPVKGSEDKENALKNIDLNSLSIRKLKEVQRRGLAKRNNTRSVKA